MTVDNDENDGIYETGETPVHLDSGSSAAGTAGSVDDTVMAAGPASGAAGVANAELGTSGPPASVQFTGEELAQLEDIDPGLVTDGSEG